MDKTIAWLLALVLLLGVVNTGVLYFANSAPSADEVASKVKIPAATIVQANLSDVNAQLATLSAQVNKDDNFKSSVLNLAKAEFSDRSYRDIFDFLVSQNISIDSKSDISSVVVKNQKVTSFDVEQKDADVTQELKVYFEDADGDDKKVYLDVDTVIDDNEVDEQEFSLA